MNQNKSLIVYTALGPTFRRRVKNNIVNHPGLELFDVLVLTDLVEDFNSVQKANIFVKNIDSLREDWSKKYEKLLTPTTDETLYANECRAINLRYPHSISRYCFKFEGVENYKAILLLDCDIEVRYTLESLACFNNLVDSLKQNTVIGHGCYDMSNNVSVRTAGAEYSKIFNSSLRDLNEGYLVGDGPVRIYKFLDKQSLNQFIEVSNFIIKDIYEKNNKKMLEGSWNILSELPFAVINKILNMSVLCRDESKFCGHNELRCSTFPEDRFWHGFPGWEFDTTVNSSVEYIRVNHVLLKKFYEIHNHHIKWPY